MLEYVIAILYGLLIGIANYSFMRCTIKFFLEKQKYYIVLLSFFLRNIIVLVLFYVLMNGDWKRLLLILLGFMIAKFAFVGYSQIKGAKENNNKKGI